MLSTSTIKNQKSNLKVTPNISMIESNLSTAIRKVNVKSFVKRSANVFNDAETTEHDENGGFEDHLLSLKKSCSDLTKEVKTKELESFKYRDESTFASDKSKKIKEERRKLEEKISQLEKNLEKVNAKKESAFHCSKTYEHILERMKKDDVFHLLKKNELERELKQLDKNYGLTEIKHYNVSELEKLSNVGLKHANEELKEQKIGRKNNHQSIQNETHRKLDKQNKLKQRQKETEEIHELAADDILDAELMKLKKFMTVQVFLRELLKSKMANLKSYYEPFEQAFFQIKSSTNVKDASSLKVEFFNFENVYNEKTIWLKLIESEIAEAEEKRKKLNEKEQELRIEEMGVIEELELKQKGFSVGNKKELNEKSLGYETTWQHIQTWITAQAEKIGLETGDESDPEVVLGEILTKIKIDQSNNEKEEKESEKVKDSEKHFEKVEKDQKEEKDKNLENPSQCPENEEAPLEPALNSETD